MTIVTQIPGKQGVPSASPPSFTLHLIFLHYGTHYYKHLEVQYKSVPWCFSYRTYLWLSNMWIFQWFHWCSHVPYPMSYTHTCPWSNSSMVLTFGPPWVPYVGAPFSLRWKISPPSSQVSIFSSRGWPHHLIWDQGVFDHWFCVHVSRSSWIFWIQKTFTNSLLLVPVP